MCACVCVCVCVCVRERERECVCERESVCSSVAVSLCLCVSVFVCVPVWLCGCVEGGDARDQPPGARVQHHGPVRVCQKLSARAELKLTRIHQVDAQTSLLNLTGVPSDFTQTGIVIITPPPPGIISKFVASGYSLCFSTQRDKSREWNVSKQKWNLC